MTEKRLRAVTIGEPRRLDGPVVLVEYDAGWPAAFDRQAARIRATLGARALMIEHVGSTSVPGLAAKPIIDILLVVEDSADEAAYVPALEHAGYVLRIREPDWHEHRMFKAPDAEVNLHVFPAGSVEIERMVRFRDRLRTHPEDRDVYVREKRALAARGWDFVQDYADAKDAVVEAILDRAASDTANGRPIVGSTDGLSGVERSDDSR